MGATIYYETQADDIEHQAENLITNLESRSSNNDWNARIGVPSNAKASYKSCYVTD